MKEYVSQTEIVRRFIAGEREGRCGGSGRLAIEGDRLLYMDDPIAERRNGKYVLPYSDCPMIRGKLQRMIIDSVPENMTESLPAGGTIGNI